MSGDTTADIYRATGDRPTTISPGFVLRHGVNADVEKNVTRVYDIPIIINGSNGCHFKGASSWSHMRNDHAPDPYVWCLQLLIMATENLDLGGAMVDVDRAATPKLYRAVAFAAAKKFMGLAQKKENQMLDKYVRSGRHTDLEFAHYIEEAARKLAAAKKKSRRRGGGRGGGSDAGGGEDIDLEGGEDADIAEEVQLANADAARLHDRRAGQVRASQSRHAWGRLLAQMPDTIRVSHGDTPATNEAMAQLRPVAAGGQGEVDWEREAARGEIGLEEVRSDMEVDELFGLEEEEDGGDVAAADPVRGEAPADAEPNAREDEDDDGANFAPYDGEASKVPKVTFTVTPIPCVGGDPNVHEDIVGYMVRFVVKDSVWNPGIALDDILKYSSVRKDNGPGRGRQTAGSKHIAAWINNYMRLFDSNHPAGNYTSIDTYYKVVTTIKPALLDNGYRQMEMDINHVIMDNPGHLCKVLTTLNALAVLRDAGGDPAMLGFRDWANNHGTVQFHQDLTTYKYLSQQVFWLHPDNCGLAEQYFPDVNMDDNFRRVLMSGGDVTKFLADLGDDIEAAQLDADELDRIMTPAQIYIRDHAVVRRRVVSEGLLSYKTNNEFMHRAAEYKVIDKTVQKYFPSHYMETLRRVQWYVSEFGPDDWREMVPGPYDDDDDGEDAGLEERIRECERYNRVASKAAEACMKVFEGLWQLGGDTTNLPIPEPIKRMLVWYEDNRKNGKLPNLTREFVNYDPDMGTFGNAMIRQILYYGKVAKIIQPLICVLGEGLFSAYDNLAETLAFHLTLHGRFDVGKSFAAITTLCNFTCIPGTVKEVNSASAQADTSENHVYDWILAADEMMQWEVSEREALKFPDLVNKAKIKLTRNQVGREVLTYIPMPNGESLRWRKEIITDHYFAKVSTTNHTVEDKGALASRTCRLTVKQTRIPANELSNKIPSALKSGARTYLQINQFLSACTKKAIMCGAFPGVNVTLFDNMSNKVIQYLREVGAITFEDGQRGLQIMRPLVRQLIVKRAIHETFDMPGSPNYKKEFHTRMIGEIAPYLYCTTDIVWFVWTALASQWINGDYFTVLRAATKLALARAGVNHEWADSDTPYSLYERDTTGTYGSIPWRETKDMGNVHARGNGGGGDPGAGGQGGGGGQGAPMIDMACAEADRKLVDINYLSLKGTKRQIARAISQYANGMSSNDVVGVLDQLAAKNYPMGNNAFRPQPKGSFAKWHKYETLPTDQLQGSKRTGITMGASPYIATNPDLNEERTEADVPRMAAGIALPVVDFGDKGLHFMPMAAFQYCEEVIVHALAKATVCDTTPTRKIMLGSPYEKDPSFFKVYNLSERCKDTLIEQWDIACGWVENELTGELEFVDPSVAEHNRPASRRKDGIVFTFRADINDEESKMLAAAPGEPVAEGDTSWIPLYVNAIKSVQNSYEVWRDLDEESAAMRHAECGRPLDEPVRTQAWIESHDKEARRRLGLVQNQDVDYPTSVQSKRKAALINAQRMAAAQGRFASQSKLKEINDVTTRASSGVVGLSREDRVAQDEEYARQKREKRRRRERARRPANGGGGGGAGRRRRRKATPAAKRPAQHDPNIPNVAQRTRVTRPVGVGALASMRGLANRRGSGSSGGGGGSNNNYSGPQ